MKLNKSALSIILALSFIILFQLVQAESIPTSGVGLGIVNSSAEETFVAPVEYDPAPAEPNNYLTLYIKAENSGGKPIENAYYKLELEYPFTFKQGEEAIRYFGAIGAKQQVQLEYDLFVDKNVIAGQYPIYLKLCYDSTCKDGIRKEIMINVKTGGVPKIEVGFEEFDILSGGKTGKVTLHVINRGDLDTKYVLLELTPTEKFKILSPNKIYVGELQSDDFETAQFEIYVNENINGSEKLMLPVNLEYTDANSKDYSETVTLYLDLYSRADLLQMGKIKDYSFVKNIAFILIVVLVFGGIANFIYRKKFAKE